MSTLLSFEDLTAAQHPRSLVRDVAEGHDSFSRRHHHPTSAGCGLDSSVELIGKKEV